MDITVFGALLGMCVYVDNRLLFFLLLLLLLFIHFLLLKQGKLNAYHNLAVFRWGPTVYSTCN